MIIKIHDTYQLYKKMINLPDEKRKDYYEGTFMAPFKPMLEIMNMPLEPEKMGCYPVIGKDVEINKMLEKLKKSDAWNIARDALETAVERFLSAGISMPKQVDLGIFIGNPEFLFQYKGITGFGGIPGYIQIVIDPNEKSLAMLPSIVVHEFHHNVLFHNAKWRFMDISVAKYLAIEGLAESFAESIYGYDSLGPWVKSLEGLPLEEARTTTGKVLNVTGFMDVRKYIFGDTLMNYDGATSTGIPAYSGYAVGYHAVQAFLKKTGISIEQATLLEGEEIMARSDYFK